MAYSIITKFCSYCNKPFQGRISGKVKHCSLPCRFWSKVAIRGSDECWEWTGKSQDGHGYGQIRVNHKTLRAPRVAWMLTYGGPPSDLDVLHKCDNQPCLNPSHLFLGTATDNAMDMVAKGRNRYITHWGQKSGRAKLSNDDARRILQQITNGTKCSDLAKFYNVSKGTIEHIKYGRNWCHILGTIPRKFRTITRLPGDANHRSKLNIEDVIEIRKRLLMGDKQRDIAKDFNVRRDAIGNIKRGKTWYYIP